MEDHAAAASTPFDGPQMPTDGMDAGRGGLLLHTGNDLRWMANGVLAAPWWRLM